MHWMIRFIDIILATMVIGISLFYLIYRKYLTAGSLNRTSWTALIVLLCFGGAIGTIDLLLTGPVIVKTTGVVLTGTSDFGVYWDVTGQSEVTSIAWGELEPGETAAVELWVKNEGLRSITVSLATGSWQPDGSAQYFDISWNFGDQPLNQFRSRKVTINLHVDEEITGIEDFSFDIILTSA